MRGATIKIPHLAVYYSDQQIHNIHINNEFYIVSTTCFDTSASPSGSLPEDDDVSMHLHHFRGVSLKMMQMHRNM